VSFRYQAIVLPVARNIQNPVWSRKSMARKCSQFLEFRNGQVLAVEWVAVVIYLSCFLFLDDKFPERMSPIQISSMLLSLILDLKKKDLGKVVVVRTRNSAMKYQLLATRFSGKQKEIK
jgi:hypothetical protein